jgi:hypothetical protein
MEQRKDEAVSKYPLVFNIPNFMVQTPARLTGYGY